MIIALSMSFDPFIPHILGKVLFEPPSFHPANSTEHVLPEMGDPARRICVLGSDRSAWDMARYFARKGITVDWVFNKKAGKPVWMMPSENG